MAVPKVRETRAVYMQQERIPTSPIIGLRVLLFCMPSSLPYLHRSTAPCLLTFRQSHSHILQHFTCLII